MDYLYITASIILRKGPRLDESVDELALSGDEDFQVKYVRRRDPIRITKTVDNRIVEKERIEPPGSLHIERRIHWPLPSERFIASRCEVRLDVDEASRLQDHISDTVQTAMAAFEICTDSTVVVYARDEISARWRDEQGVEYSYQIGSAEFTNYPVTILGEEEQQRYPELLAALGKPAYADVLAAYSVSRLNPSNFSVQARTVFAWSLIERIVKTLSGKGLTHSQIRDFAVKVCTEDISRSQTAPFTSPQVVETLEAAYNVRNGLAHGQRAPSVTIDYPTLSYATTLLCRRLAPD